MGFLDDIISQQSGGGMLGGLPASWQYANPDSLTSEQKQMMALVGTQNPAQVGFNPLPQSMSPSTNFTTGTAPLPGLQQGASPFGLGGVGLPPPIAAQPALTFGAGASPTLFANPPGSTPGNPALPIVASDDDEEDKPAPAANASPIGVGNYQMPRVGPAAAFAPNPAALPVNARPTQGQLPTAPAAAPSSPGILQHIGAALNSIGAPNSLFHNVVTNPINALITGQTQAETAKSNQDQVANMTATALINRGVPKEVAIAAVQPGNGEMLKELFKTALMGGTHTQETDKDGNIWDVNKQTGQRTLSLGAKDDKFQHVTVKDALGNESVQTFNTKTGEFSTPPGAANAPGGAGFGQLLAQGVTYDPNKSGEEYMNQFSPEVQAAAKAYINGDVMPTGNARKNSIATFAKTVAQKYGMDTGAPVNDSIYAAKRKMQTDLASSGNSSMGGILSNGESSFKHLAEYTVSAADQGNASHNFPGGGTLAHIQNYVGNAGGGSDTQGKVKAINDNLGKYGAESTKFYAGTGGGVEERLNALKEMNATTTSGEEAASYAEKEKSLMLDRLNTKFQEIRNTLGEERGNAEIAKHMPDIQKNVATIDANIARLRGKASAADAKPATVTQNGHTYNLQPDGSYK